MVMITCPTCNGDKFVSLGDRHVENRKESCTRCGGKGEIDAATGQTPETSFNPSHNFDPPVIDYEDLMQGEPYDSMREARRRQHIIANAELAAELTKGNSPPFDNPHTDPVQGPTVDPVVEAVRKDLLDRSRVGLAKYGTPLSRTDLGHRDWLQHAYEEALDLANYLKRCIMELDDAQG